MPNVKPIPEGYTSVTPYLFVKGAAKAIDFYKSVFGATEIIRMPAPNGAIMHAEITIGNAKVMLADENPQIQALSPQSLGGTTSCLHVYVANVDSVVQKAADSGSKLLRPVADQFYGDRTGTLIDPFGHMWSVATHIEDVTPQEMKKRMTAAQSAAASS